MTPKERVEKVVSLLYIIGLLTIAVALYMIYPLLGDIWIGFLIILIAHGMTRMNDGTRKKDD